MFIFIPSFSFSEDSKIVGSALGENPRGLPVGTSTAPILVSGSWKL